MNNVLSEVLQFEQFFPFGVEFLTFAAQQVRQKASEIRNGEKSQSMTDEPNRDGAF